MSNFIFNETERTIAIRYIKSRRVEGFISVSAWFSLIGIVLGVATLIVVMSVMNGFRTELVDRILGINGHLIVYKKNGLSIKFVEGKLRKNKEIIIEALKQNRESYNFVDISMKLDKDVKAAFVKYSMI